MVCQVALDKGMRSHKKKPSSQALPLPADTVFFVLLGEKGGREGSENLSLNRISHGLLTLAFLTGSSSQKKGARTCGA